MALALTTALEGQEAETPCKAQAEEARTVWGQAKEETHVGGLTKTAGVRSVLFFRQK